MCDFKFSLHTIDEHHPDPRVVLAYKQAASPILPSDDPFTVLMIACDNDMAKVAAELARTGNTLQWVSDARDILQTYHRQSHTLGFGGYVPSLTDGRVFQVLETPNTSGLSELDYLQQFLADLSDKETPYRLDDGGFDEDSILRRMRMYQGKMRGTAGWGFVDKQSPVAEIEWILGAVEEHCPECPMMADLSPWDKGSLWTTPGSGETTCIFNCKCWLKSEDETSAKPVERAPI